MPETEDIIISNYISLLQFLFCRSSKFARMRGCNCSFIIEKGPFREWMALQLELRINSISLKNGISTSASLKETQYHWKY